MTQRIERHGLQVAAILDDLITQEVFPGTGLEADKFWRGFGEIVAELGPRNQQLLEERETMQTQMDDWHKESAGRSVDLPAYKRFLAEIGYWVTEQGEVQVTTSNVDPEIAAIAGPQLVVPVTNARFALNAANARWGSLYDALYGTDVIAPTENLPAAGYDAVRGAQVIAYACRFLDQSVPLEGGSHSDVAEYLP